MGRYDDGCPNGYVELAKKMGAQYFTVDNWKELFLKYGEDEMWKINEKFLDMEIDSGKEIFLSHDPKLFLDVDKSYGKELRYLQKKGYRFQQEGNVWHAYR